MQIFDAGPPVNPQDLLQIEENIQADLPVAYRSFLLQYNGGRPEPNCFSLYNYYQGNYLADELDEAGALVHYFYCLNTEKYNDLRNKITVFHNRMPPEFLPIADDPGGNQICIVVKGIDTGKVFYWDHEAEAEEGSLPTYSNIYLVADNFDDFINSLHELREEEN